MSVDIQNIKFFIKNKSFPIDVIVLPSAPEIDGRLSALYVQLAQIETPLRSVTDLPRIIQNDVSSIFLPISGPKTLTEASHPVVEEISPI